MTKTLAQGLEEFKARLAFLAAVDPTLPDASPEDIVFAVGILLAASLPSAAASIAYAAKRIYPDHHWPWESNP